MHVLILRDPRESLAKCSLTPLRGLPGLRFVEWRAGKRLAAGRRILLHARGDELSGADLDLDLLLIDCAWRKVDRLL